MALLERYEDFLDRVDELGFMALSHFVPGFPSLTAETPGGIWHTGNADTDPWCWKDRAAEEKRLAFGCILGGHKGFVSARMYPLFYAACHPGESVEERWAYGQVNQTVWKLWQLFDAGNLLDTGDIRREMGVSKKKGGSRVDTAVRDLQQHYYITVAGSRRKLDRFGQPYGWAANTYMKVTDWVPADWMEGNEGIRSEAAQGAILDVGTAIGKNVDRDELAKVLGI